MFHRFIFFLANLKNKRSVLNVVLICNQSQILMKHEIHNLQTKNKYKTSKKSPAKNNKLSTFEDSTK